MALPNRSNLEFTIEVLSIPKGKFPKAEFNFLGCLREAPTACGGHRASLTLVEIGECFVVELDGRGSGGTQHVLERQNFVLVFRRQT